jgi:LCP family protein required for cell wall assembly
MHGKSLVRGWLLALLGVLLLVAADAALLSTRVDRMNVDLHPGGDATWVLVGVDSRAHLPAGASPGAFGTTEQVPGARADVVLVVHLSDEGSTVLSVPRDVVVASATTPGRLALSWMDGPQSTIDGLCGLGIPSDHLVSVDLGGFASIVDAAGGLEVDVPAPVRDPAAGLEMPSAGRRHVDGSTALAMVRSRHPEQLVDGHWSPAPVDADGRAATAGAVLAALEDAIRGSLARPWRMQGVAWAASGALTVDTGTSPADLAGLLGADLGRPVVLPVGEPLGGTVTRAPTARTSEALAAAGLSCTP